MGETDLPLPTGSAPASTALARVLFPSGRLGPIGFQLNNRSNIPELKRTSAARQLVRAVESAIALKRNTTALEYENIAHLSLARYRDVRRSVTHLDASRTVDHTQQFPPNCAGRTHSDHQHANPQPYRDPDIVDQGYAGVRPRVFAADRLYHVASSRISI
jgi:hypothetical protein